MFAIIEDKRIINPSAWQLSEEYQEIDFKYEEFIEKPEDYYIYDNGEVVINPNFDEEQIAKRKANFESQFIETSMKDTKGDNGYYRQIPEGYANAPQTIELVDKYVRDFEGMTEQIAQMLIFYQKPDFTKAEECTEEWLVAHQFNPPADMTLQKWKAFEFDFQQRWALLKYKQQEM